MGQKMGSFTAVGVTDFKAEVIAAAERLDEVVAVMAECDVTSIKLPFEQTRLHVTADLETWTSEAILAIRAKAERESRKSKNRKPENDVTTPAEKRRKRT